MLRFTLALAVACAATAVRATDAAPQERYQLDIMAPKVLKERFERDLDLVRWQNYVDMSKDFLRLLVEQAKTDAKNIAETEGYFSAQVTTSLDESQTPPRVTLAVEPGPPTRISSVAIDVSAEAAADAEAVAQIARIRESWGLPKGAVFQQAAWDASKAQALRGLTKERYAGARIGASEAAIDPERRVADLNLTLDSGPPFRFGALIVHGTQKYRESYVRNLASFSPGDSYSIESLDEFVRRLNTSGYFASAQAIIDTDPASADAAPVDVTVIEAPSKRLSVGLGFSTDTLFRGQFTYNDYNVDHDGLQFLSELRIEGKEQSATLRLSPPPTVPGHLDSYSAELAHTDLAGLVTQEVSAGWERRSIDERNQTLYSARYYDADQRPTNADPYSSHALYVEYGRAWRTMDDLVAPTRGYVVSARLGAGVPSLSTAAFGRTVLQAMRWWSIDNRTQLSLRGEAGAVFINDAHDIPNALAFRTGGDTSVRGYAYLSLGPREGDATVGARYYSLASAEITRWIRPVWGIAAFIDAGNASNAVRDLKPVYGYGVGARVRTPIGPFRVDLAYGEETRTFRLHLSVGMSF